MPRPGENRLNVITPTVLEMVLITTRATEQASLSDWDFVGENHSLRLPSHDALDVTVDGKPVEISQIGFKRRPLYAPLKTRDLRILNQLYLRLKAPIPEGGKIRVVHGVGHGFSRKGVYETTAEPMRFNPAIHVNQVGYQPEFPKRVMVGYYLGSLGELDLPKDGFEVVDAATGKTVFEGKLKLRADQGFAYSPTPYQKVYEANFDALKTPGVYRIKIPGMGASFPFQIHQGTLAAFARAYALGLYHQRCGTNNVLPFTRHTHGPCHVKPAAVPDHRFKRAEEILAEVTSDAKQIPSHSAPPLSSFSASLYPFVRQGSVSVQGGHHDAGDYSKYTINSAGVVHALIFAADNFEGAGELDNLGLPESGDGKSDLLQEAMWEADFLVRMQDLDGGFYFLVYPKERRYEDNVLPDQSDPQIVWPKNTSATAAAVAALAEAGSSPLLREQFPEAAERYLISARRGWAFLERALEQHGKAGAYQKLTHYGNEFGHDDELVWASAALFAATGEKKFQTQLMEWFNPEDTATRRWSWWPMFEAYGCATRTYVFAARNGRRKLEEMNPVYVTRCENLIHTTAQNHVRFARETAYGTSFPDPNKANQNAGWYFSSERAFDMTVAWQLRKDSTLLEAILGNLNYEAGCNPVNVSYLTGVGWRRQREIVHQYAQNDRRVLPPGGIPIGNIQGGFPWLHHYKKELGELTFPPDGAKEGPYPFYDRWGDTFNTTTEFVVTDQARSLASIAYWMAQTPLRAQPWRGETGAIAGVPTKVAAGKPVQARFLPAGQIKEEPWQVLWEARGQEPVITSVFRFTPAEVGEHWVEVEALWPDGRRVSAATNFTVTAALHTGPNLHFSTNLIPGPETAALFHLDGNLKDAASRAPDLKLEGKAKFDQGNLSWMKKREGSALRFFDLGDRARTELRLKPAGQNSEIILQAMIYINGFKGYNKANANILSLKEEWHSSLEFIENLYEGPMIKGGTAFSVPKDLLEKTLTLTNWHHLALRIHPGGYELRVNGQIIAVTNRTEIGQWGRKPAVLEFGNFDGYIDEVAVIIPNHSRSDSKQPEPSISKPTAEKRPYIKEREFIPGQPNAIFWAEDGESQGKWAERFGKLAYKVFGGAESNISFSLHQGSIYTWSESTRDDRALEKNGTSDAVAACLYHPQELTFTIHAPADEPVQLSLYFLDWDRVGREQVVELRGKGNKELLDVRDVTDFAAGKYLQWIVTGSLDVTIRKRKGSNALLTGMFLDPISPDAAKRITR